MIFWKKHKGNFLIGAIIAIALVISFFAGDAPPVDNGVNLSKEIEPNSAVGADVTATSDISDVSSSGEPAVLPVEDPIKDDAMQEDATATADEAENQDCVTPPACEQTNATFDDGRLTCTLCVRCDTILGNMNLLNPSKISIVPKDGIVFAEKEVEFFEGESGFNVMLREMKRHKIHFEFVNTPMYESVYIEGVANIYEFDCGELSGWLYRVNGVYPAEGISKYRLKDGDKVEIVYTCNMGADVGNTYE